MRIAYVLNTYPQPSHSFIRRELHALERQGFTVTRLAMRGPDMALVDPGDRAEAERTEYVLDRGMPALLGGLFGLALRRPALVLRAAARAWRMGARAGGLSGRLRHLVYLAEAAHVRARCAAEDVRHIHAHFGTNAAAVAHLCHALGGPGYSFTVHGPEEFDAPRALSLGEKIAASRFTVGVSSFGRSQLCRWVDHADWPKIHVVHCGIEYSRFTDAIPTPENGPLRLVSIGRFVEQKGQMILLPAMQEICAKHPDAVLHLVGDGPLRPEIEAGIAAAGLTENIKLIGWLDEVAIRAELDAAHALLMPSFAEGLPMVVMEAMAAARPVIATYIAGTPELVRPGETGWLTPAGDPTALAAAACELAEMSHENRDAMGQSARRRVLARHDVDTEAAKLADLIRAAQTP
ncbi:glycosyltransferase [Roseovarius nubinhibens]|uniref:glycosyltransferase n=1 Tax=Roseovarius nubinhibens TaxID=314263 RepID=UPI001C090D3F|nr:glycosyltransferase [Roseovarius nubinhibens]MBU3001267.1 glycosyltransferase [Roseovarius nubinhibens]